MADRTAWTTATPVPGRASRVRCMLMAALSLVTGDLALNKTVSLFKVPANFTIVSASVYVTDMDTNGSPARVLCWRRHDRRAHRVCLDRWSGWRRCDHCRRPRRLPVHGRDGNSVDHNHGFRHRRCGNGDDLHRGYLD